MIPNLQPNTTYAAHLRAPSTSGGKDWVGSFTAQGEIHTYWGKTGQINQHAGKPGDATSLNRLISQKMNGKDKYTLVDEYMPHVGWKSQSSQTQAVSPKAKPMQAAVVDWSHEAPTAIQWDF